MFEDGRMVHSANYFRNTYRLNIQNDLSKYSLELGKGEL